MAEQAGPTRLDKVLGTLRMPIYSLYRTVTTVAYGMAFWQLEGLPFYLFIVVGVLYLADKILDFWARERRPPLRVQEGTLFLQGEDAARMQAMLESVLATAVKQGQPRSGMN